MIDTFAMYLGYVVMIIPCLSLIIYGVIIICDSLIMVMVNKLQRVYNHTQLVYVMGLLTKKGRAQTKKDLDL